MKKRIIFSIFFLSILIPNPVHAYAGPGVAIAAILVFITVIFTFFASILLKIFKYFKQGFLLILRLFEKKKKSNKLNQGKKKR